MEFTERSQFKGGRGGKGGHKKPIQRGLLPKKGRAQTVCQFKWGTWQEKGGGMFLNGVDTRMHTMSPTKAVTLTVTGPCYFDSN